MFQTVSNTAMSQYGSNRATSAAFAPSLGQRRLSLSALPKHSCAQRLVSPAVASLASSGGQANLGQTRPSIFGAPMVRRPLMMAASGSSETQSAGDAARDDSASVTYVADEKLLKDGLALDARYKSGESLSADELEQHSAYRNVLRERAALVNSFDAKTGAFREQFQSGIGTARPNLWMPADCLKFLEEDLDSLLTGVEQIRSDFAKLPKEGLETLIGNTIVEDGLANYARGVVQPEYSAFPASNELAKWAGGWLAEEQRHERVLVELCLISDRVDSKQLENTSFTLLTHGFDGGYSADVVKLFVYTMVQELATFYSHKNVAALSKENGGEVLPKILMKIAGDEFRHYMFYVSNFKEILTANPDLALVAYSQLMKDGFAMPATKMDRPDKEIYNDYVYTAQKSGVFSLTELAKCVRQVNEFLKLDSVEPATDEGKTALQFLQDLPATYEKRAGKLESIEQRLERKNGPREIPTIWSQPSAEERKSQGE